MSQLPIGKTVRGGPDTLLERPELAVKIAMIVARYALLEDRITMFYSNLMGSRIMEGMTDPVALQVMDLVESGRTKLRLVGELLSWRVGGNAEIMGEFHDLVKGPLRRARDARNDVAHARWGVCDDYKDALIRDRYFGSDMILKAGYFDAQLKEIRDAQTIFSQFTTKARELVSARATTRKEGAQRARSAAD